ncbi:MAG: hypothetical protein J0H63_09955 [Rhizobiales bacterium]|nr:hypothetical protein [Hyphomicrobiales bacterium]MBN9010429.1 hypothetical protein [Hyphomicrobiales bacterium]
MNVAATTLPRTEPTVAEFLSALSGPAGRSLLFHWQGKPVRPGYHVTEIKQARVVGLDCGANVEAWTETFIQLFDVDSLPGEPARQITTGKFLAILGKFRADVGLAEPSKLTFEVSEPDHPLGLFAVSDITEAEGIVQVSLEPRPASCKPRDRWLEPAVDKPVTSSSSCCA